MTTRLIQKIEHLTPIEFENLVFDLVHFLGLENLVWRTPGPDGGRDIEGDLSIRDFSGSLLRQHWFIECKRYSSSIDWPTVWNKLAYAENAGADYLLIVTTASLSPARETEVAKWNAKRRQPRVRAWRGYDLEVLIARFSAITVKYGFSHSQIDIQKGFFPLAFAATKFTQSAYSASQLEVEFVPSLEAAAALSELLSVRLSDIDYYGQIRTYDCNRSI